MSTIQTTFRGVTTAMVTPFHADGSIDFDSFGQLIEHQIAGGVKGLLPCGSTGEAATLSHIEHAEIFRFVVEQVNGRARVLAGTGSNSTAEAIELTQAAEKAGVDAVLLITPYYNKPSQAGLLMHYRNIAAATGLPIVLYDIPGRTQVKLHIETVSRLSEVPNIQGIKDACGSLANTSELRANLPSDFAIFSGDDALTLPMMAVGADGVISVASHLLPTLLNEMLEHYSMGRTMQARAVHFRLLPLMQALFLEPNPCPVKYCLLRTGVIANAQVRLPLVTVSPETAATLDKELQKLDLL